MRPGTLYLPLLWLMACELFSQPCDRSNLCQAGGTALLQAENNDAANTSPAAQNAAAPDAATDVSETELSEEEQRQAETAERFLGVLRKSPRRGTALDRVYGHHVEFGTLDRLLQSLRERTTADPQDGAGWMLLGMLESQRGADAVAMEAFQNAERTRPDDPLAAFYLGQSQLRVGQSEEAVAAFERALQRQPQRSDLLDIYQQLGRVHQRAQRTDEALQVWQRLESLFPDDPRVLEQVAVTLAEEGQLAQSLLRYERLARLVKDEYRRVVFQTTAAELKIRTGQKDSGVAELESVLANLNPESWLHRDVRRRIEEVFLKTGDQDSLVLYYQKWLERNPEDVEAIARLARFLAASARVPEAIEWMQKALQRAPTRSDLRKAFIVQLTDDNRMPEAIREYEQLVASDPANAEYRRDWGRLILKDRTRDQDVRRREAAAIWHEIVAARPDDPVTLAQTADLFRHAGINDEALALYQKAVTVAPEDPQYREYLGEFLHSLHRPDDALQTWTAIAAGSRRTTANVTRLAEICYSFGYLDQAVREIAVACEMDPRDFRLQVQAAEYHARAEQYDPALSFVAVAEKLAASDDEREAVIRHRTEILQFAQRLEQETETLAAALRSNPASTLDDWHRLARYHEALRQWTDAAAAIREALLRDPASTVALTTAARIAETSGNTGDAAEICRRLAKSDRRSRGDHLMNVARLEAQLGRSAEALAAGQELIVAAPGNTDNYEFVARLCFQLGKPDDGLTMLRKAVRINPGETHLITALATALAEQLRTEEAIELYWRAFDKSEEIEDKTSLTMKLAPLYQQINQYEQLIERLERERRDENRRREMTICLAQAYQVFGDIGTARQELESLLTEATRDTSLLQQLAKLCDSSGDIEAAIGYQRQLVAIAPGHETEFPLALMLQTRGDRDEATEIIVRLTQREVDPVRLLKSIDGLLSQGNFEAAISVTEPLLSQQRGDWELLYREGVAWASAGKSAEAENRFRRLLSLTIPHETLGVSAEAKFHQAQSKARSDSLRGLAPDQPLRPSPLKIGEPPQEIQRATGLIDDDRYYGSGSPQRQPVWTPDVYGAARMAAFGWLLRFADEQSRNPRNASAENASAENPTAENPTAADVSAQDPVAALEQELAQRADADGAGREAVYDCIYLARIRGNGEMVFRQARRLAGGGGREEQQFFLDSLRLRAVNADALQMARRGAVEQNKTPLSAEDLQLALDCFHTLDRDDHARDSSAQFGGQIVYSSNGQAYIQIGGQYVRLTGAYRSSGVYLAVMIEELNIVGRNAEADALRDAKLNAAKSSRDLAMAIDMLIDEEKTERIPELYERWSSAALQEIASAPETNSAETMSRYGGRSRADTISPLAVMSSGLVRWIGHLAFEQEQAQILNILERALDVAVAESRHRRQQQMLAPQNSRRQTARNYQSSEYLELYYGKESFGVQLDFPRSSLYVDRAALHVLREVAEVLKRNDAASDLTAHLRKRVELAEGDELIPEQMMLASALWWLDDQDEAVGLFTQTAESLPGDLNYRFSMAEMRLSRGDFQEALELTDSVVPDDQQLLQRRELLALQLAERLGDNDRARQAAERLFGLRLDTETQLGLVDRMRRLGMHEMAGAVISRAERQSGNSPASLASLMLLYQGQGRTDQAKQLAHMLLQRTDSTASVMSSSRSRRFAGADAASGLRSQALQLLLQTGDLKLLIQQTETLLERSPDSIPLCEKLFAYYTTANETDKLGALLKKIVTLRPEAASLRKTYAQHLQQTGKLTEACDQYLELVRKHPESIGDELMRVDQLCRQTERSVELAEAIRAIDIRKMRDPWYLTNLASNLIRDDKNTDVALDLYEKICDAFPSHRRYLIQNIQGEKVLQNQRVYQFAKRSVIPTDVEARTNTWFGLDEISSYAQDGEVSTTFHMLLSGLTQPDRITDLQTSIQQVVSRNPDWKSGPVMLALIDLKTERKDEARQTLESLAVDESVLKSIPSEACWVIGQELDKFQETRNTALKLFENALASPDQQISRQQLQYSPVVRLIRIYSDSGRNGDARDLLLKHLRSSRTELYDPGYGAYQKIENSTWVADRLVELGFPIDAVQIYSGLLSEAEKLQQAGSYRGDDGSHYTSIVNSGFSQCLLKLDANQAKDAVGQILQVPDKLPPQTAAFDLMLSLPDVNTVATKPMESRLIRLLASLSEIPELTARIDSRLNELRSVHPADLSIATVLAITRLRPQAEPAARDKALQDLAALVTEQPLEELTPGRRPNSRQRRVAAQSLPLWLVARECIASEIQLPIANQLATRALLAARRQIDTTASMAILFDWGRVLLQKGQQEQALSKWTELLKIATERPQQKPKSREPRTSLNPDQPGQVDRFAAITARAATREPRQSYTDSGVPGAAPDPDASGQGSEASSDVIPPLTISQFRLALLIAVTAAENGMAELSRSAVREALAGGIPVADPEPVDPNNSQRRRMMRFQPPGAPGLNDDARGAEVASSVLRVVSMWRGDDYPAAEVCDLLRPLVLPSDRHTEILTWADSTGLATSARVTSLGESLVRWAHMAGRLDELRGDVEARSQHPGAQVPALVLLTQIALATDQIDTARSHLLELGTVTQAAASPAMLALACHAAIPAADNKSLQQPAFAILMRFVQQPSPVASPNFESTEPPIAGELAERVNKYLAEQGDTESVRKYYDSVLQARQLYYSRHGGDYAIYMHSQDLSTFANQAAAAGMPDLCLDFLGRATDVPGNYYNRRPQLAVALASVCRHLGNLPPHDRYAAWHRWTMPVDGRQTIRMASQPVRKVTAPRTFLEITPRPGVPHESDLLCNLHELVDAAKAANTLAQLRTETEQAYERKLPNAEYLLPMVLIALNDLTAAQPLVQGLLDTLNERHQRKEGSPWPDLRGDYAVYRACLTSPDAFRLYGDGRQRLRTALQTHFLSDLQLRFEPDFAQADIHPPGTSVSPDTASALKYWFPASTMTDSTGLRNPWWEVHEDQIAHISGSTSDLLYFAWPLEGNFEFSVDSYSGPWAETDVSYGGILVQAQQHGPQSEIVDMSTCDLVVRPQGLKRGHRTFNRVRLQSVDGRLRYLLNDHLVYEEPLSGTSPWIALFTDRTRVTSFRNLRLDGQPVIPREVRLLQADRMDGWISTMFGESQPNKRLMAEQVTNQNDQRFYRQREEPTTFSWSTKDGILQGTVPEQQQQQSPQNRQTQRGGQSWIYYHRPLRDAESFRYEFYYVPEESAAHPTIGRLAFLFHPDGVRSHWIGTPGWDDSCSGIPLDNEVVEAACQRGGNPLPLKPRDWNHVDLTLTGQVAVVSLNGVVVFERPLEPQLDHRFGLFRWQSQSCRVRNAVLTGPWPTELTPEITENLIATNTLRSPEDRRLIHSILTDKLFEPVTAEIVAQTRAMPPEQAYQRLSQWVMPSIDHPNFRLYFRISPIPPAGVSHRPTATSASAAGSPENIAVTGTAVPEPAVTGTTVTDTADGLLCPAVELVQTAHRMGRSAELAATIRQVRIDGLPDEISVQERNRQALLTLIEIESGDAPAAEQAMEKLLQLRNAVLPKSNPAYDRSAELVVAWQACRRPELLPAASRLAQLLLTAERNAETASGIDHIGPAVDQLRGRIEFARERADAPEGISGEQSALSQWHPVGSGTPQQQVLGRRPSQWLTRGQEARHLPGGVSAQLYFQSPLRGQFSISAECTVEEFSELAIVWGAHAAVPARNLKAVRIARALSEIQIIDRQLQIPSLESAATFQIEVDGTRVTTRVNGHQIHQEDFSAPPDPWLLLQPLTAGNQGSVRHLQILGTPVIPSEIDLIDMAGLAGWRADLYGDTVQSTDSSGVSSEEPSPAVWKRVGDELIGSLRTDVSARPCESLLKYQRPLLEDAEIEFEMFSVPGEFEVHPAIGRTAFLLQPDGVHLHHLTSAPFEFSGLQPDNRLPLAGAGDPLQLIPNDWNRVLLKLRGDQLTITLNGSAVASYSVPEAPAERWFGLFRYSDLTQCRIRKLVYRGDWPTVLPEPANQQLAHPGSG